MFCLELQTNRDAISSSALTCLSRGVRWVKDADDMPLGVVGKGDMEAMFDSKYYGVDPGLLL